MGWEWQDDEQEGPTTAMLGEARIFESVVAALSLELLGTQGQQEAISHLDFNKELLALPELDVDLSAHLIKVFPCLKLTNLYCTRGMST